MARVLVADDDELLRFTLRAALEGLGHLVVEAQDGDECATLLCEKPFNLVFMDADMPGRLLTERLDCVRTSQTNCQLIVLTGMADAATHALVGSSGTVLQKPLTLPMLTEVLKFDPVERCNGIH